MAEAVQTYIVTPLAGEFVAGNLHGGVGTPIRLTDAQARYELLLGTIVLDGTAVPVEPPAGPVTALDRLELTRGSKPWDASVGELAAFLLMRILPEVTETLGDVEGRIVGGAAAADNTLGKLAIRIATLAEQTQAGLQGLAPLRSPAFREAPTAPTPLPGSNSDRLATTAYVTAALAALGLGAAAFASTGSEAGNVPVLDARGKLLSSVLPALAITDIAEVGSQAEMLALTAQTGDIAIRTDLNRTFALAAEPASTLANWKELRTPTDTVLAVAGLTGTITAAALRTALALGISDISGLQTALNGKQAADGTLTALANLTTAADQLIYATGSDQFALTAFTGLARTLLAGADAAAMRGSLGVREVIRGNSGPTSIPAGATRYLGIGVVGGSPSDVWVAAGRRGRLSNLRVITQAAPGDGQSWTFTIQKLFADTALTCSIAGTGTNMGTDLTRTVDFEATDRLCIKVVATSGAPATSAIAFSLDFLALD